MAVKIVRHTVISGIRIFCGSRPHAENYWKSLQTIPSAISRILMHNEQYDVKKKASKEKEREMRLDGEVESMSWSKRQQKLRKTQRQWIFGVHKPAVELSKSRNIDVWRTTKFRIALMQCAAGQKLAVCSHNFASRNTIAKRYQTISVKSLTFPISLVSLSSITVGIGSSPFRCRVFPWF